MAESVFLSPKSIAVIGASDKRGSVGSTITSNIMNGFTGTVYPISPSRDIFFCYQNNTTHQKLKSKLNNLQL